VRRSIMRPATDMAYGPHGFALVSTATNSKKVRLTER
jgi:hypothetical protein